jgi:hypothetical protein
MSEQWYYQFLDQEMGPVDFRALQQLAVEGTLSGTDLVRNGDTSDWVEAASIPELIPEQAGADDLADMLAAAPVAVERSSGRRRGTDCYYRTRRGEVGPIPFEELATLAQAGVIGPLDQIRLGSDTDWIQADTVIGLFSPSPPEPPPGLSDSLGDFQIVSDAPAPASAPIRVEGDRVWYCRILKQEVGPFTFDDVHAMAQSGQLGRSDEIREGESGEWIHAGTVVGLFPKAVRSKRKAAPAGFDVDQFLTETEAPEEQAAPQHIAPQRMAVITASQSSVVETRRKTHTPRDEIQPDRNSDPAAPRDIAPASQPAAPERRPAMPEPVRSPPAYSPPPPRAPIAAPKPVPRPRKSMGNPFSGLGSAFGGLSLNWKPLAVVVALFLVAAVLYGGLPFSFSRGPAIYEETLALWERAQQLHQPGASASDWEAFKTETKPRVDELKTELVEEASAKDRLLQLMLYCYRDCLPPILSSGPQGAPDKWKEMEGYMQEAAGLAKK